MSLFTALLPPQTTREIAHVLLRVIHTSNDKIEMTNNNLIFTFIHTKRRGPANPRQTDKW